MTEDLLARASFSGRFEATKGHEQTSQFRPVFEPHTDHLESGLMRAHESNYGLQVNRAKPGWNLQRCFCSHGKLNVAAQEPSLETEDADGRRIFSAPRCNHGRHVARKPNPA